MRMVAGLVRDVTMTVVQDFFLPYPLLWEEETAGHNRTLQNTNASITDLNKYLDSGLLAMLYLLYSISIA